MSKFLSKCGKIHERADPTSQHKHIQTYNVLISHGVSLHFPFLTDIQNRDKIKLNEEKNVSGLFAVLDFTQNSGHKTTQWEFELRISETIL